ncbi:hypothetical protein H6P81_017958 [Aristolochia fimbriata]|nr:hypothetical protein H6P81_017958 [Aristolochia fimbriata]
MKNKKHRLAINSLGEITGIRFPSSKTLTQGIQSRFSFWVATLSSGRIPNLEIGLRSTTSALIALFLSPKGG